MIKSYNDMLKEISSGTTKDLEDIYDSGYCAAAEDIMSTNICQLPSKNVSRFPICFNIDRHSLCLFSAFSNMQKLLLALLSMVRLLSMVQSN
jgi:hypothetical protein